MGEDMGRPALDHDRHHGAHHRHKFGESPRSGGSPSSPALFVLHSFHPIPCTIYHTIPCHAMPCHAMPCHPIPSHPIPSHPIPSHSVPSHLRCRLSLRACPLVVKRFADCPGDAPTTGSTAPPPPTAHQPPIHPAPFFSMRCAAARYHASATTLCLTGWGSRPRPPGAGSSSPRSGEPSVLCPSSVRA